MKIGESRLRMEVNQPGPLRAKVIKKKKRRRLFIIPDGRWAVDLAR